MCEFRSAKRQIRNKGVYQNTKQTNKKKTLCRPCGSNDIAEPKLNLLIMSRRRRYSDSICNDPNVVGYYFAALIPLSVLNTDFTTAVK